MGVGEAREIACKDFSIEEQCAEGELSPEDCEDHVLSQDAVGAVGCSSRVAGGGRPAAGTKQNLTATGSLEKSACGFPTAGIIKSPDSAHLKCSLDSGFKPPTARDRFAASDCDRPRKTLQFCGVSSPKLAIKSRGQGPKPPGSLSPGSKEIKCPRCGKCDFQSGRELGKHAVACRKQEQQEAGKDKAPAMMGGGDRMAKLMNIKRMQRRHEEEGKNKEEQAKIDREMELLIKMEHAREKRDLALKKKREAEEKRRLDDEKREAQLSEEKRLQLAELEKVQAERAEAKRQAGIPTEEDSGSESESDDEAAAERRRQLRLEMGLSEADQDDNYLAEDIDWLESPYEGYTAAHLAAYYDDVEHMAIIIQLDGDVVSADPDGRTPLHICALYGHDGCMEQLAAIVQSHVEAIEEANVQNGANMQDKVDTDATLLTRFVDSEGKTPLHTAASVGNYAAAIVLGSADPGCIYIPDQNGDSPLHTAAYYGYEDCCAMLLQLGAPVDGPPNFITGKTPAAVCASLPIIKDLVAYGADYYGIDYNGRSVLFDACANNLVDIVSYLISLDEANNQVIINYGDSRGDTPLHAAACNGHSECVQLLLQAAADPYVQNQAGLPPVVLALVREKQACVDVFIGFGVEPPAEEYEEDEEDEEDEGDVEEVAPGTEFETEIEVKAAVKAEAELLKERPLLANSSANEENNQEEFREQHTPSFDDEPVPSTHVCSAPSKSMHTDWEKYIDEESGLPYYFNKVTSITQWEPPQ